eukprot:214158-Pyramimonas_sp.AAC.1
MRDNAITTYDGDDDNSENDDEDRHDDDDDNRGAGETTATATDGRWTREDEFFVRKAQEI